MGNVWVFSTGDRRAASFSADIRFFGHHGRAAVTVALIAGMAAWAVAMLIETIVTAVRMRLL